MIEIVNSGVIRMDDIKTFDEVIESTGLHPNVIQNNIRKLKNKPIKYERKLIPGVDYLKTRAGVEKYTPAGIEKVVKEQENHDL